MRRVKNIVFSAYNYNVVYSEVPYSAGLTQAQFFAVCFGWAIQCHDDLTAKVSLKKWIGSAVKPYTDPSTTMHSVTDWRTDRRQYDANGRPYCV